ncbi:MAG TPA: phage/plasmid primase, P4 family [Pyrinomonadaceae bacterium]|jgi:putative DNA primase/helicase
MLEKVTPPTATAITISGEPNELEVVKSISTFHFDGSSGITGSQSFGKEQKSTVFEAATFYVKAGLSIFPIRADGSKAPAIKEWKPYQNRLASEAELRQWFGSGNGLAIVAGKVSGNLEILDHDAPELYEPWRELVDETAPGLLDRLTIVQTPSGGYHLYYRCQTIEGNKKLAEKPSTNKNGKPNRDTLIETRGEGGYALVPPSPPACHEENKPYVLLSGSFKQIAEITVEERQILLDCARSFDECFEEKTLPETTKGECIVTGNRPGDEFNRQFTTSDWNDLLSSNGWQKIFVSRNVEYWRRPGKTGRGISATVNYKGSNLLYVFSSNAYPLNYKTAYTPFAALTFLQFNGDFTAAAKVLAKAGFGKKSFGLAALEQVGDFSKGEANSQDASDSIFVKAPLSDTGNAECMASIYRDSLRYDHTRKKWLYWDEVCWRIDKRGIAESCAVTTARSRYSAAGNIENLVLKSQLSKWGISSENANRIEGMLKMARIIEPFSSEVEQFDSDPYLAATKNGTLELRTGIHRASRQEDYLTKQFGAVFDSDAKAPRWEQFLKEIFGADLELIDYIQRCVGYTLTGDMREQVFFLCHGGGSNGKSKFLEVLSKLMADYAGTASFETFDAGKRSEASNDLAALKGKRLVTVIETDQDRRLAEAKVKTVTGQDELSCRFLYGEFFSYRPEFKIWMAMNHKPVIRGTDKGIWRRIRLIPFTQSFENERDDKTLIDKLLAELPGILNWALEGLRKWQADGLPIPKAISEATEEYRHESDPIGQWIEERTSPNPNSLEPIQANVLYKDYSRWAQERSEHPFSHRTWGQSMSERGYSKKRSAAGYNYYGLKLEPEHF